MTDLDIYEPAAGQLEQYSAALAMTPETAKVLDDQLTQCIRAILHEGTDYGVIPGTGGDKSLWRPGAQKLLQWFRFGFTCDRVEIDTDDEGRKEGVTYRCTIFRQIAADHRLIIATCEGYAGYDEDKFYQSAEQVQDKAEARERMWAKKDGRVANPTKWKGDPDRGIPAPAEYRAPWNSVIKRAQKRAIVGATLDATAAGGRFNQDREEDDHAPAPADDGPSWYEQALESALTFLDEDAGRTLYVEAAHAARDGLCTPRQANHIQNRIQQRAGLLKKATPVDVEDLGRQGAAATEHAGDGTVPAAAARGMGTPVAESDPTRPAAHAATSAGTGSSTAPVADDPSDAGQLIEEQPGTVSKAQLTKLHTVLTGLGFGGEDRDQKLKITETIIGRRLGEAGAERSSKNLSWTEGRTLIDTLDGFGGDRDALIAYMAEREQDGSDA